VAECPLPPMKEGEDVMEIRSIEEWLETLEKAHKKQVKMNFANNLMMARVSEEIDSLGNKSKEDRLVMISFCQIFVDVKSVFSLISLNLFNFP
jgi:hypothetical protein